MLKVIWLNTIGKLLQSRSQKFYEKYYVYTKLETM